MEHAGPSKRSVPEVSLALLPTTRCRSLHRRVSRSFWRERFGCAAAPAEAMPKKTEPSRLDNWFLGVACAGSQRPALGASLPDVHEELTGRGRHLLLPETDLLTPPPSPPSVVQLRVYGGPPGGAVSCDASVSLYCLYPAGQPRLLFRACRYLSGLIRRGLCGLWRRCDLTLPASADSCCLHPSAGCSAQPARQQPSKAVPLS